MSDSSKRTYCSIDHTTPPGSPHLQPLEDSSSYSIPPSILKRLTPVSPQKKDHQLKDVRSKLILDRTRKLKEYSLKIERINQKQKSIVERKRRYSNESLQQKLDNAKRRRVQSNKAKSRKAKESFKMISSNDSIEKSVKLTKMILRNCEAGIIDESYTIPSLTKDDTITRAICQYLIRHKCDMLLHSNLFSNQDVSELIKSQQIIESVGFIFKFLGVPSYNKNDAKLFLQSFHYLVENYHNNGIMNSLNTTLPKIKDKEPFKTVFDNRINDDITTLLLKTSHKLIIAFKFLLQSGCHKFSHQFLVFIKIWKLFNNLNSIFLKFHSIRSILNLNYSIEILLRSQFMLKLKLKDHAYATIKQDLISDIAKYDIDIRKLKTHLSVFKNSAKLPTLSDIYFVGQILKQNKAIAHTDKDMFPTFLGKMNNWRMVLMHEEYNKSLAIKKENCNILDNSEYNADELYLSKYNSYCELLGLENFVQTLSMDQTLVEFGVKLYDFLNNSLNANRLFPPINLSVSNFKDFFQTAVLQGFRDILTMGAVETYNLLLLSQLNTEESVERGKDFLVELVGYSVILIINSNSPADKISFEKYQFNRKFEILNCPVLVERSLQQKNVDHLIIQEICNFMKDSDYQLIETLQMFKLVIQQLSPLFKKFNNVDKIRYFLINDSNDPDLNQVEIVDLKNLIYKLIHLNEECYRDVYKEVFGYLERNWGI